MKIAIVFNTFESYHRQNVAVDSWRYLKKLFPDTVDLYNLQFSDEKDTFINPYPDIDPKFVLSNSKETVKGASKKLPFMNEMFNMACKIDCDYFIITNSDVIIMPLLLEVINNTKDLQALACSRLDIEHIDSFQRILAQQVKPVRWEIAGFDTFVFNKTWAQKNHKLFQTEYLMGKPLYDVVWAGYMKIYGGNQPLGNGYPPYCFHLHHGTDSVLTECVERDWNVALTRKNDLNMMICNAMVFNLTENLVRRTPKGAFLVPAKNEQMMEKQFFDCMSINRTLI